MFKSFASQKLKALTVAIIVCIGAAVAHAQEQPAWNPNVSPLAAPTAPVNDYANVIDDATEAALNQKLIEFQRSSGVELAVAVVNTTGERPIFDYSLAVARGWGVGAKEDDNPSALLLVAVDDRKYFTQVSKDLEDELPDALAGSLQRQFLVPEFKQGNYGKGISDTVDAYIRTYQERSSGSAASPTPVPGRERGRGSFDQGGYSPLCCLAVIVLLLLVIFSNRGGRSGRGGGGWGGGFGGGGGALPWIIGSAIANAASSSSSSSSGWGGGSSWGGDSGGGGGWGGFGGGGDFGGGGAGGDW
ncbi:MAG TPA: TPM domain-containing protein [Pyrinomonadaceae bacterium]|nr:TPM domain-containing protein [Pyrinomonadaceae bacterium]